MTQRVHTAESAQAKNEALPGLLPLLQKNVTEIIKRPTDKATQIA
jgi:hypothetical protein